MKSVLRIENIVKIFLALLPVVGLLQAHAQEQSMVQPYYITPRTAAQHIDVEKDWQLGYTDSGIQSLATLDTVKNWITVANPTTVQIALTKAGKLPHPYYHLNAQLYEWVDKKVWYYRKQVDLTRVSTAGKYVFLCFDGLDYFSKIWFNGKLVGSHEGMFGGPAVEVGKLLRQGGANEIVVEIRAADYGQWNKFDYKKPGRIITSIDQAGGEGSKPFFALGMWRKARFEIVEPIHLERPFLYTTQVSSGKAVLFLETEVFVRKQTLDYQLHPWQNQILSRGTLPADVVPIAEKIKLDVSFTLGRQVVHKIFDLRLIEGRNWVKQQITIDNPRLWMPVNMGKPNLYHVVINLIHEKKTLDEIAFSYGVRTIQTIPTQGIRTTERLDNLQFVVNNKPLFIKGVNWMPADALLDLPPEKYRWLLGMAKSSGIQLIRVWAGGLLETEDFYNLCDSLGIMVWQDFQVWHQDTPDRPQDIWEAQVVQNIFRLRNRTSLAIWCGGNGFNPYSFGSVSTVGIVERSLSRFDPTRPFLPTTSDAGNIHTYPDMDPARFAHLTRYYPFITESGMHSITEAQSLKELVREEEFTDLGKIYDKDYASTHPEVISHFVEYLPYRVPRMVSRASHINNMKSPSIGTMSEASQVGAGEFFQLMSEGAQSNYPATAGIMPWVYNRPWPVFSAIMLVDGLAQPTASYYFLKRTYQPVHVALKIPFLLWAPGEKIKVETAVMYNATDKPAGGKVAVTFYSPGMKKIWQKETRLSVFSKGTGVRADSLGSFVVPESFRDQFFFAVAELTSAEGRVLSRAVYWPRCLSALEQDSTRKLLRGEPATYNDLQDAWIPLPKGPWLQPSVEKNPTLLTMKIQSIETVSQQQSRIKVKISNTGSVPSFMTQVNITGAKRSFYATDNFTWLAPGESKVWELEVWWRDDSKNAVLTASAWNAPLLSEKLFK